MKKRERGKSSLGLGNEKLVLSLTLYSAEVYGTLTPQQQVDRAVFQRSPAVSSVTWVSSATDAQWFYMHF